MKSLTAVCLAIVLGVILPALHAAAAATNDIFPIMAWNSVPSDLAVIKKMRECGLTVAGFVAPKDLELCRQAGLKAIVSDSRVSGYNWRNVDRSIARKNVESLVGEVGQHPSVYGYYLVDEPGAQLFPGLATVSALIKEMAPGKWPYINLFPNYASPEQLGTKSYEEYLDQFVSACRPTTLSYDHYALMDDGTLRSGYWQNLDAMRKSAIKNGLPFWNIVLTVAHFNYREPTAADLRFQVYSTLAYGGRGIAYFTYFAPQVGNYRQAPIDQFGNPTPTWHYMQNINLQVAKLAPTLLELKSDNVYHFNGRLDGVQKSEEAKGLVEHAHSAEMMAGDFTHADGTRYVMIVNTDVVKSRYCAPKFRTAPKQIKMVSPYTGHHIDFAGEQTWLSPGQGVLLRLVY